MSSLESRHPSEEHLLSFLDGELPPADAGRVQSHLKACWQCRAEMEALEKTIARCVEYRKNVLEEHLPPPPAPWADLSRRFAEIDASQDRRSWFFSMPRWVPVAAALALSIGIYQRFSLAPTAQAAALLRNAASAAEARRDAPRRIQIRTRTQRLVRSLPSKVQPVADAGASELKARFNAAHYDWNDPLSAQAFQQWREQLPARQDSVATENGRHRIRTTSEASELTEATLALRSDDLRPIEGTFRFRDNEIVEITELPAESAPVRETAVAPSVVPETPAAKEPVPPPPAPETTAAMELQVVSALQRLGADLGESIEVRRTTGSIEVRGVGIDSDRQRKIQDALAPLPLVNVQFINAAPAGHFAERTQAVTSTIDAGLQSTLEERAGGRARLEQLSIDALDRGESLMARVYALRRLAERFPQAAEARFSDAERSTINGLLKEHAAVLRTQATELERRLSPLLGTPGSPVNRELPVSWQAATGELFRIARRTETLLAALTGGASIDIAASAIPSQLLDSLSELRTSAEAYQDLLDNRPK